MAAPATQFRLGLAFAVASAVTFGLSGPFAKSLMEAGWSPTAAVTARMGVAAVVMAVFASIVRPGWIGEARRHFGVVLSYGAVPIAGAQLCYYNAISHLSVGVALLLEYTAPILVAGWIWATTRRRPDYRTMAGIALAAVGITLVLNIFGDSAIRISGIGVLWGAGAALCAACYFLMGARASSNSTDGSGPHVVTLAAGGLVVGSLTVAALGVSGLMPLTFTANNAVLAGHSLPWLVPVLALGVVSTAVAYTLGIYGVAWLRAGFASLVGLAEVLFAVAWAWLLVGEALSPTQAIGGAVVLVGLALARGGATPAEAVELAETSAAAEHSAV
jgi:drug/metabolite transporter (DMT)-like permease